MIISQWLRPLRSHIRLCMFMYVYVHLYSHMVLAVFTNTYVKKCTNKYVKKSFSHFATLHVASSTGAMRSASADLNSGIPTAVSVE